jgi:hypothetical protein
MVADLSVDGTKPVNKSVVVDRSDEFTLDVAGLVEARVGICFHFHMQGEDPVGSRQWKHDDEWKTGSERVRWTEDERWAVR